MNNRHILPYRKKTLRSILNILALMSLFLNYASYADKNHKTITSPWPNGTKVAVVLSYDDALESHITTAIPQLNSKGLVGTFYLTGGSSTLSTHLNKWREAAKRGHELGNHTLFHPCRASEKNRDWVKPWNDLDKYTIEQYMDELRVTDTLLHAIDGQNNRSYAYTCVETLVGGKDISPSIEANYIAARGLSKDGLHQINNPNFFHLAAADAAEKTSKQLIALTEKALETKAMIGFMMHGVGAEHLRIEAGEHLKFLDYLSKNQDKYWVTTVREAVAALKKYQANTQNQTYQ